jgi:hypothetical protein
MPLECEELLETMVGHETISLSHLTQDSMLFLRTRRQGMLCGWEKRNIYILSNVLEVEV